MKRDSRAIAVGLLTLIFMLLVTTAAVYGDDYDVLKDVKKVKAIFDVRAGNPEAVAVLLDMMLQTTKDKSIVEGKQDPEFAIVFIGPSVKLISTQAEGFFPEDKEALGKIANTISEMSESGIRLEICLAAAGMLGVDPATVLPEIKRVPNGLISLMGYQAKGYSLIPIY